MQAAQTVVVGETAETEASWGQQVDLGRRHAGRCGGSVETTGSAGVSESEDLGPKTVAAPAHTDSVDGSATAANQRRSAGGVAVAD